MNNRLVFVIVSVPVVLVVLVGLVAGRPEVLALPALLLISRWVLKTR